MFDEDDDYENDSIAEELIIDNCGKYLNRLRTIYENTGHKVSFKRGSAPIYDGAEVQTFVKRTKPMNTNPIVHKITNEWFYMKFGIRAREECLFVTNSTVETQNYGTSHYIFPVGGFSTVHSNDVKDLFLKIKRKDIAVYLQKHGIDITDFTINNKTFYQDVYKEQPTELEMAFYEFMESLNYVKGKSTAALLSNNEVMLRTPRFIMVPINERYTEFMNEVVWN